MTSSSSIVSGSYFGSSSHFSTVSIDTVWIFTAVSIAKREELIARYAKKDKKGEYLVKDNCYVFENKDEFEKLLKILNTVLNQKNFVNYL